MKVLMIIPSLSAGGAERVLTTLANDWCRRELCEVQIVILSNQPKFYKTNDKIKIHHLNYQGNKNFKNIRSGLLTLKLRNLIRLSRPDICLSFTRESNIITLIASAGLRPKVFISERDSPLTNIPAIYSLLRRSLYPLADGLIVQTNDYKLFASSKLGVKNISVISNPVRNIMPQREIKKENIILNVGRLVPEKGQKYLLESFALCKFRENWKLVIAGEGHLCLELENLAKRLNIDEHVCFIGNVNNIDDWYFRSSIFAFSSISEGFPNALCEAMSASLPCVAFDCVTGPRELIENETSGYLIDIGDTSSFSKKIDELINSKVKRESIGRAAMNSVKNLDVTTISDIYFNTITKKPF